MKLHQSDDKIIVTELMPMSEAPLYEPILIMLKYDHENFYEASLTASSDLNKYAGWLPMPIYQPESKVQD